jgi:RNA polymerase sigma-70 factor, ECF subfamily
MRNGNSHEPDSAARLDELIRAARNGSRDSLEKLLAASRNYLWTIAKDELPGELRPKVAPSDVVQETLIEAHRDFRGFVGDQQEEFFAWLRRILLNNLSNTKRRYRGTTKRDCSREVQIDPADSQSGPGLQLPTGDPTASSICGRREQNAQIEAAIEKLPDDYRTIIQLRHRDDMPFHEVAARMGRSEAACRKLWSRAIEKLQRMLNPPA